MKYKLNNSIVNAGNDLKEKLSGLNVELLNISDYNKRYFGSLIKDEQSLKLNINKYSYLLKSVLKNFDYDDNNKPIFLDYGAGHGMMNLLAVQSNLFSKVIYSDIFEQSANDARIIANDINLLSDFYFVGDIIKIEEFVKNNNFKINIMTSYDVLEHIYNIEHFISKLPYIFDSNFSFVMASGANPLNPFIAYKIRKLHINFENNDRPVVFGRKSTDTLLSLRKQRENIILKYFKEKNYLYNQEELLKLTNLSRGLLDYDINYYLKDYIHNGFFNYKPDDPTNTCDSLTGNWFERLMNPFLLANKFRLYFAKINVSHGYYFSIIFNKTYLPKLVLNTLMFILPTKLSIKLSPYYIINGKNE